jgi:hypothetical protein
LLAAWTERDSRIFAGESTRGSGGSFRFLVFGAACAAYDGKKRVVIRYTGGTDGTGLYINRGTNMGTGTIGTATEKFFNFHSIGMI